MTLPRSHHYQFRLWHLFVVMTVAALLLGSLAVPEPPAFPTVTVEKYSYAAPIDSEYLQYTLQVGSTREVFFDREPFGSLDAWGSNHSSPSSFWWRHWPCTRDPFVEPMPKQAFVTFNNVRSAVAEEVDIRALKCFRFVLGSNDEFAETFRKGGAAKSEITIGKLRWVGLAPDGLDCQTTVELPREFRVTADSPKSLASLAVNPAAYVARDTHPDEEDGIMVVMFDGSGSRVNFRDSAPFGIPDDVWIQPHGKPWQNVLSYYKRQNGAPPWQQITDDMRSKYRELLSAAAEEVVGKRQPAASEMELWTDLENGLQWMIDLDECGIEPLNLTALYRDLDAAPQVVSISSWQETLFEGDPFPTDIRISRWKSPKHKELTVFLNLSGSAVPDLDYKAPSSWFTIPAGEESVDVSFQPLPDSLVEDAESILVDLARNDDYEVESDESRVQLQLIDGRNPVTLGITLNKVIVEDHGTCWAELVVRRSESLEYDVRVGLVAQSKTGTLTSWSGAKAGETTWLERIQLFQPARNDSRAEPYVVRLLEGNYAIDPDAAEVTIPLSEMPQGGVSKNEPGVK